MKPDRPDVRRLAALFAAGLLALAAPDDRAADAAAPAPAASAAAAASSAAPTPAAPAAPVAPAASPASVWLPPRATCIADASDPDRCGPLTLERDPVTLPAANLGRAYARLIRAEGGLPPYEFDLMQGNLPGGLVLDIHGRIAGTPDQAGSSRFRVRVVDAAGSVASQAFTLRVLAPVAAAAKPASAPASAAPATLTRLDLSQAGPPAHATATARVYQLEPAQLDALKTAIKPAEPAAEAAPIEPLAAPEAPPQPATGASASTPPPPASLAWSDAQHTQLEALLQPVFDVEYPTRSLFEAAVDAQVCAQAWQLIVHEAQRLKQQPPSQAEFAPLCPTPPAGKSATKPALVATAAAPADMLQPVSWRDLPAWLMPPGLRDWLVEAAGRDRALLPTKPVPWKATAPCNCAAQRIQQPLYAVYPAWLSDAPVPQTSDFSLINRATFLAWPLGDEAALNQLAGRNQDQTAFIREAIAHETRIDLGIYRADWRFLATEPATARDAQVQHLTTEVPRRVRELLDTPLPGLAARAKAWLPGFGQVQRMGNGVTVFFDRLPDAQREPQLARRFAEFYPAFVKGLAQAMVEHRQRQYAINLVMTDRQMADGNGPFDVSRLFELLKAVEDPVMADGRIVENNSDYQRNNNIELRLLVLLSEPTGPSAKALRLLIGNNTSLNEGDRRIFLRSVVPVLLLPQASLQQYRDDLIYVQDNFGGIGFWPAPLMDRQFDSPRAEALLTTFGPDPGTGVSEALCSIVCPNRWPFRLAFELLLLAGAICWALLQWRCEWRDRYGRYALFLVIPPLLVGAALVQCDPALAKLRNSNASLLALLLIPLVGGLWVLLKRREDKP